MSRLPWRVSAYVLVGILAVLAFWPVRTPGLQGGSRDADAYESKLAKLSETVASGGAARMSFSERELNARMARLLDDNAHVRESRGLQIAIRGLRAEVVEGQASLYVAGRLTRLPFVLEYRLSTRSPGHVDSVRLGRLPLVQPLKWMAVGHLRRLLRGVRPERDVLEHLRNLEVEEGEILVAVAAEGKVADL